jgi:hypothetical protein
LLLTAYFVLNTVQYPIIRTKVQAASDAAAHAATLVLDPNDQSSWDRALVAAISALRAHEAELGGFGDAFDQGAGPVFEDSEGRATITIERGRYLAGVASDGAISAGEFESLEEYPESVRIALANAVNVRLQIASGRGIGSVFAPQWINGGIALGGLAIASESTVTFVQHREFVPPFALPLCALLNGTSHFDPAEICRADRLFTTLEWKEKFSGAVPDFMYDPGPTTNVETDECFYNSPQYADADNNYGVIGLPSANNTVEVEEVLTALDFDANSEHPGMVETQIGARFAPLRSLAGQEDISETTATEIGTRIWQLITNPKGVSNDARWPTFAEGLADVFNNGLINGDPARVQPNWVPFPAASQPDGSGWSQRCGGTFTPAHQNMCGSRRFRWNCASGGELCEVPPYGAFGDTVWRVRVPLIARLGDNGKIAPCGDTEPIDPDEEYRIIAFVTVSVYDTDIGDNPTPPLTPRPNQADLQVKMSQGQGGAVCSGFNVTLPVPPSDPPPDPPQNWVAWGPSCAGPEPMYLQMANPSTQSRPCNVVRARVECETAFEATKKAADGTFSLRLVQ